MGAVCLRFLVPLFALLLGTWIGAGRPSARLAREAAKQGFFAIVGRPDAVADRFVVPAVEMPPPTPGVIEPELPPPEMPPLRLEWPRSNPDGKISRAWLLAEGPYHPPGDNHRYVTFTFDDGPFPEITPHVLDVLRAHGVRATFFVIGRYLQGDDARSAMARDVVRRAVAEGHLIGNHTEDHKHLTEVARSQVLAQIDDCSAAVERVTGQPPLFFRPPYGDLSRYLEGVMAQRKTEIVLWSIEDDDLHRDDEKEVAHELRLRMEFQNGGIVLLHDIRWKSVVVLDRLLRWLDDHRWDPKHPEIVGYDIVDLPEYLRKTAESPQPFPNRQALDDARRAAWRRAHPEAAPPPKSGAPVKGETVI